MLLTSHTQQSSQNRVVEVSPSSGRDDSLKTAGGAVGDLFMATRFISDMCSRFCLSLIVKQPQEMNTELLRSANKQVILKTRNQSEEEFCLHRTYGPLRIHINLIKSKHSSESNTHCGLRQRYTRPAPLCFLFLRLALPIFCPAPIFTSPTLSPFCLPPPSHSLCYYTLFHCESSVFYLFVFIHINCYAHTRD